MRTSNGPSVAQALEIQMKKKVFVIGGIAAAGILVGGWALAQSHDHGPGGFGPGGMMGMRGQMGLGMHGQMGPGMRGQMGRGMMGMGPGMMGMDGGSATAAEHSDIRDLFFNHESIRGTKRLHQTPFVIVEEYLCRTNIVFIALATGSLRPTFFEEPCGVVFERKFDWNS
jgi:hypothetical protein